MSTKIDQKWAQGIRDNVNALILEVERLENYSTKLEGKLETAEKALETISYRRARTIFIEESEHVTDFFKPVDEALAAIRGDK